TFELNLLQARANRAFDGIRPFHFQRGITGLEGERAVMRATREQFGLARRARRAGCRETELPGVVQVEQDTDRTADRGEVALGEYAGIGCALNMHILNARAGLELQLADDRHFGECKNRSRSCL